MTRPLRGLRLVVSGFELEQQEHRGIAVFTKGLLRSLKEAGAEIWLLTEIQASTNDISVRRMPKSVHTRIIISRTLDKLNNNIDEENEHNHLIKLISRTPILSKFTNVLILLKKEKRKLKSSLFPRRIIRNKNLIIISKEEFLNSPYTKSERLSYLQYVDGLICAKNCFIDSFSLAKFKKPKPLLIDLRGFDGLITTSPQNIKPLNTNLFAQTIHDLIPLDYQRTGDHLPTFTRRLQAARQARKIFVSKDAELKYFQSFIEEKSIINPYQCVVTQSPSLEFPSDSLEWEARTEQIKITSNDRREYHIKPYCYFLFNSSVVPHKNLLFAIKAFLDSGLEERNISLCITGKPQNDAYSESVRNIASNHKSLIFTGYVDESTKRKLYLNALALLSPSLVEGFGIPVLDAACLGLTTIASEIESHREIQAMNDFENYITLCSTQNKSNWSSAMRSVSLKHENLLSSIMAEDQTKKMVEISKQRIERYRQYQALINQSFQKTICNLLISKG